MQRLLIRHCEEAVRPTKQSGFKSRLLRSLRLLAMTSTVFSFFVLSGCAGTNRILTPDGLRPEVAWTDEEKSKTLAINNLKESPEASYHLIRLAGAEKPHTHDTHDLTVFILKGKAEMHLGEHKAFVEKGDVMEIPRGTLHWAECRTNSCLAYAVFTPAYDGKDFHPVSS